MNNNAINPVKKHFLLPLLLITQERNTHHASIAELFIFFIRYSFLFFNEPSSGDKILKRDVSYSGELSSQKSNGARYLDPKYSRWISVDPALGEYVPAAGKANAKDVGGIPGMGGLFNGVNLNLFHYAGNNPVRYVDPDGRISVTSIPFLPHPFPIFPNSTFNDSDGGIIGDGFIHSPDSTTFPDISSFFEMKHKFIKTFAIGIIKLFLDLTNTSDIPSQGVVDGGIEGAPKIDAGKQGKHVKGHPNYNNKKSTWKQGSGLPETQLG